MHNFFSDLRELHENWDIIWILTWTDFKIRYKNSFMGYLWSLIQPLGMLGVFYLVFSYLIGMQVEHYALFLLLGIIMWNFVASSTQNGILSLINKSPLVTKIYFPRYIILIANSLTQFLSAICESAVFLVFMVALGVSFTWTLVFVPYLIVVLFVTVLGISLALAALNVFYRDITMIWAFVLQVGFFITPILFPPDIFPAPLRQVILINPFAVLVTSLRDCVLYNTLPSMISILYITFVSILLFTLGYSIFRYLEPKFAEEI